MDIHFFIPEKCLLYTGIVLYIIISVLVTRHELKKDIKNNSYCPPLAMYVVLGVFWPIVFLNHILNGVFNGLGRIFTLGIKREEKPRF